MYQESPSSSSVKYVSKRLRVHSSKIMNVILKGPNKQSNIKKTFVLQVSNGPAYTHTDFNATNIIVEIVSQDLKPVDLPSTSAAMAMS